MGAAVVWGRRHKRTEMILNTNKANAAAQDTSRQALTPPKGAGVDPGTYPLFTAPEEYLRFREHT